MSDLWLDSELDPARLREIADVVRESGLGRAELEDVFALELAPFLGSNQRVVAGEWAGFDPEWVCAQARALREQPRFKHRLLAWLRVSTHAARPAWKRVKALAFRAEPPASESESP